DAWRHHPFRRRRLVLSDVERAGGGWTQMAYLLGVLHHELRFLDRYQPCRHSYLRHTSTRECNLAAAGHALCGSHYGIRIDDRCPVSNHSPWAALVVFLADSLSIRATDLAELTFSLGLGFFCDFDVLDWEHAVPIAADHPGFRTDARPNDGLAKKNLSCACPGLARNHKTVATPRSGHANHGDRHRAG